MGMLDGLFDAGKMLAGLIPGAGPVVSGLIGAGQSMYDSSVAESANRNLEARQDNAVQRRVADLRAAGLAPQLGAGGASSGGESSLASPDLAGQAYATAEARRSAQANAAAALMRQNDDHLLSQAHVELVKKQTGKIDADQKDRENAQLASNSYHDAMVQLQGRRVATQEQRAGTQADLAAAREAVLSDQKLLDDVSIQIARKDGLPKADADLAAARAIASVRQDTATQSGVETAPLQELLKHVSPVWAAVITSLYSGAKNLGARAGEMLKGGLGE